MTKASKKITTIQAKSKWQLFDFAELWQFRNILYILSWRNIKVRYKQTVVGLLWVILQPLTTTFVFTVIFGIFAEIPSDDLPYPVFVLTALVFWGYFSNSLTYCANSFIENEHLVKKVYFPREFLPLSAIATGFVDFLVGLILLFITFLIFGVWPKALFFIVLPLATIITILSATGLGLLLSAINVRYRDVRYILPFFLQLLIFLTPVMYATTFVRPSFQYLLALNPMTGVIYALRSSLRIGVVARPDLLLISIFMAIIVFSVGALYFRSAERYFADIL